MWDEPYLETCCRSTLHRVLLCEGTGRPQGLRDQPCLERLQSMGFVTLGADGRFHITPAGLNRHDQEIGQLKPMSARASRHRAVRHRPVRHRADRRSGTDRNGL